MAVNSRDVVPSDPLAIQTLVAHVAVATSQTNRAFFRYKPGFPFRILRASAPCITLTNTVSGDVVVAGDSAIFTAGAISVHSTPTQLALALSRYVVGGTLVEKAAATGITFSAAHVISAGNKFGVVLIMTDSAGTISTKVPSATQAYASAALAVGALPAADANKLAIGYLLIESRTGASWTANTDNMTPASGLTAITITTTPAKASALASGLTYASLTAPSVQAAAARSANRGSKDDWIYLLYTSGASGALVNGFLTCDYRPQPMNGEGSSA